MDTSESPERAESPQDQAAREYLAERAQKKKIDNYRATVFGCCGCILFLPVPLAILGALFI